MSIFVESNSTLEEATIITVLLYSNNVYTITILGTVRIRVLGLSIIEHYYFIYYSFNSVFYTILLNGNSTLTQYYVNLHYLRGSDFQNKNYHLHLYNGTDHNKVSTCVQALMFRNRLVLLFLLLVKFLSMLFVLMFHEYVAHINNGLLLLKVCHWGPLWLR